MDYGKFKYGKELQNFEDCPPQSFKEKNKVAFRWVHQKIQPRDFLPLHVIKSPPARMLDDEDKMCMGYGLSMFDTLLNAVERYKHLYGRLRRRQKDQFVEDKGDSIAKVDLKKQDGVCDNLTTKSGHFTFHEYKVCDLSESVIYIKKIFDVDGSFEIPKKS